MARMTKEDILHLSQLARIELKDEEVAVLQKDISSILEYVSTVNAIAGETVEKQLTPRHNIFREDVPTETPGQFTEDILNEAPKRHGQYVEVKKILSQDE